MRQFGWKEINRGSISCNSHSHPQSYRISSNVTFSRKLFQMPPWRISHSFFWLFQSVQHSDAGFSWYRFKTRDNASWTKTRAVGIGRTNWRHVREAKSSGSEDWLDMGRKLHVSRIFTMDIQLKSDATHNDVAYRTSR